MGQPIAPPPAPAAPAHKRLARRVLKRIVAWRYRHFRLDAEPARWVRVAGWRLRIAPTVFNPGIYFTSGFLARYLARPGVVPRGGAVLDLGTGSGIMALVAARSGAGRVVATDLNPRAVRCAAANVARYGLATRVDVRAGDLFAPVAGEQFDLIVCNPPYFPGTPHTVAERALLAGPAYEWLDRFAAGVAAHVAPGGRVLLVLGDAADLAAVLPHLAAPGAQLTQVARRDIWIEVLYLYILTWPGGRSS